MTIIEDIKREVLEEWFGTDNLNWVDSCPSNEITKNDVLGCIELAIKKTLKRFKNE